MATSGRVYSALREGIVRGTLAPGARLVEVEIAKRLGVSRTPVREALTRLEREGYVATPSGKRARPMVAPLTKDDVSELLYIVGDLEGLAARRAALLAPPARRTLLKALTRINESFLRAAKKRADFNRLYEADEEFHRKYVEAGAGPRLRALHEAVKPQAERYIRMYVSLLAEKRPCPRVSTRRSSRRSGRGTPPPPSGRCRPTGGMRRTGFPAPSATRANGAAGSGYRLSARSGIRFPRST